MNKPTYSEYLKIVNDTKYTHKFQKIIYNYSKETGKNISFKNYIIHQIADFLKDISIEDLNFPEMKKFILETQTDKVFLYINNGSVSSEIINDKLEITETMNIKNNNTIVFNSIENNYSVEWLLRWKNHMGCAGPAWQISLKYNI